MTSYHPTYFYLLPRGGKARCLSGTSPRRCVVSVGCCVRVYKCVLCIVGPRNHKCGAPTRVKQLGPVARRLSVGAGGEGVREGW